MIRFKTKQELDSEYGDYQAVPYGMNPTMLNDLQSIPVPFSESLEDALYNCVITREPFNIGPRFTDYRLGRNNWTIGPEMIFFNTINNEKYSKIIEKAEKEKNMIELIPWEIKKINETQLSLKEKYGNVSFIFLNVTGNCQIFSVCYFDNLLNRLHNLSPELTLNIFYKKFQDSIGKQLFYFDIVEKNNAKQLLLEKTHIVHAYRIVSTNGSKLICGIGNMSLPPNNYQLI